jgi:hypothetical protein
MTASESTKPLIQRPAPGARRDWSALPDEVAAHAARLSPEQHAALGTILLDDLLSEYDARFLVEHLAGLGLEFSPAFQAMLPPWAEDELRHFHHIREVYDRYWGLEPGQLDLRRPDFGPLETLFEDEFSILCLGAYDELATVRAYRANLDQYGRLGPAYARWARALVADEAWHYATFLGLLLSEHRHRLPEAPAVIDRIEALEGIPYGATFVLDHGDPVFTAQILADAARVLRRQLDPGQGIALERATKSGLRALT